MKKTSIKEAKTLLGKIEPPPVLSKRQQKIVDKKLQRYLAFISYFQPPVYVRPAYTRKLMPGIIIDKEKGERFLIHHKINFGGVVKAILGLRAYNEELTKGEEV